MAGDDVRLKAAVKSAEDELNLIKNQVQQTLLDIREHILDVTNPFNKGTAAMLLAEDKPEDAPLASIGGDGGPGGSGGSDSGSGGSTIEEEILPNEDAPESDPLDGLPQDDVLAVESDPQGGTDMIMEGGGPNVMSMPAESFEADAPAKGSPKDADDDDEADDVDDADDDADDEIDHDTDGDQDPEPDESDDDTDGDEHEDEEEPPQQDKRSSATADLDLVTLAALVRWVSVTTQALGPRRVEVLLDAYESAGRISPQVRTVIRNFCALSDEDPDGHIPVRDVLSAMVRMEGVVGKSGNGSAHRLMAILLDDEDDPLTRLGLRG